MKYFILTLLIFTSFLCFSQDEDDYKKEMPTIDENTSKYLDDGVHNGSKDFLTASLGDIASGLAMVSYERKLSIKTSFVVGLGYMYGPNEVLYITSSPISNRYTDRTYYVNIPTGVKYNFNYAKKSDRLPTGGLGYSLAYKSYIHRSAITSRFYHSLNMKHYYSIYNGINYSKFTLFYGQGWTKIFRNNIGTDIGFGIGGSRHDLRVKKDYEFYQAYLGYTEPDKYKPEYMLDFQVLIKLGYFF